MQRYGVSILGSTGSIGQNTLSVIAQHPERFQVIALSANHNASKLLEQCLQFQPAFAVLIQPQAAQWLRTQLKEANCPTQVLQGISALALIAQLPEVTKVVAAIVGAAGLVPTMAAVTAGKHVLLANKESLVMAGDLMLAAAGQSGAILLPVDSEHNALFQCMPKDYHLGTRPLGVKRLILTASGGPFLHSCEQSLTTVTPEMACQHPTWKMGQKISVDSATLMNKGLEVIEACRLFQLSSAEVEVIIHPQSIVHSLVEYSDRSVLAQLGVPDMRIPIAYCLAWPERCALEAQSLSLHEIGQLTFLPADNHKFKCLPLAYEAIKLGGAAPTVLNASNEIAVEAFLKKQIKFLQIPTIIEKVLQKLFDLSATSLAEVLQADQIAREHALGLVQANG